MNAELHPSIVALVSLSAAIAAKHPDQGLCQIDRLRQYGVSDAQVDLVIEIARHLRDEAALKLDGRLDEALAACRAPAGKAPGVVSAATPGACCTPTKSGQSCC